MRTELDIMTRTETRITSLRQPLMNTSDTTITFFVNQEILTLSESNLNSFLRPLWKTVCLISLVLLMTPLVSAVNSTQPMDPFMVGQLNKIKAPQPMKAVRHLKYDRVVASWYGPGFDGRLTASGVHFHQDEMTVASRTIRPFGTHLLILNPVNGNYVIARVTDCGPFHEGRDIDLSHGVAFKLGLLERGVGAVLIAQVGELDIRPILYNLSPKTGLQTSFNQAHSHIRHSSNHSHFLKQPSSHLTGHVGRPDNFYALYHPRHPLDSAGLTINAS